MSSTLVAHAAGTVAGAALTPRAEYLCDCVRTAQGVFTITVGTAMGSNRGPLKPTIAFAGETIMVAHLTLTSETVFVVTFRDAAGVAQDPDAFWVTLERLNQVSVA